MNETQIAKLPDGAIAAITEGLRPYRAAVEHFGYRLMGEHA